MGYQKKWDNPDIRDIIIDYWDSNMWNDVKNWVKRERPSEYTLPCVTAQEQIVRAWRYQSTHQRYFCRTKVLDLIYDDMLVHAAFVGLSQGRRCKRQL